MGKLKSKSLAVKIILGLALGIICGLSLKSFSQYVFVQEYIVDGLFYVLGKIFISTLKMLVVPLVFVSLVCGVIGFDDVKKIGRLGAKTLLLYLLTTAIAISMAIIIAKVVNPGVGFNIENSSTYISKEAPPLKEVFVSLVPSNPIKAASEGNMLQIIVFAIIFGLALSLVKESSKTIINAFNEINHINMKMVTMLMVFAPYGVFALIAKIFYYQGLDALKPLASYFGTVLFVLLLQLFLSYGIFLTVFTRLNPAKFYSKLKPLLLLAFSTASSNACIPLSLKILVEKIGVSRSIASFTVPLGATINMDGTAIMQGVATVFIAQAYNIDIGISGLLTVVLTATLASIGTAGVPGVGLITLAMVLRQVGLPVEGIALIIGVDRLLDMVRTAVNVSGDATVACIVASSEKEMDKTIFNTSS